MPVSRVCGQCAAPTTQMRRGLCQACYARAHRAGQLSTGYTDPAPVIAHLAALAEKGVSSYRIQSMTGLTRTGLWKIKSGKRTKVNVTTAEKILSIPIPEQADEKMVAWIALCEAGKNDEYISPNRKYRDPEVYRKWRRARTLREEAARKKRRRAIYEKAVADFLGVRPSQLPPPPPPPTIRTVDWSAIRCGDCEALPCRCVEHVVDDVAWLRNLADHDNYHPAVATVTDLSTYREEHHRGNAHRADRHHPTPEHCFG